jgi:hypothetical protein
VRDEDAALTYFLWALVAATALFGGGLLLWQALTVHVKAGTRDIELRFVVVDATTGAPLRGVKVYLLGPKAVRDYLVAEWPFHEGQTDAEGRVTLVAECRTSGKLNAFETTDVVHFSPWQFVAWLEGYVRAGPEFVGQYTGWERPFSDRPPPIRIELRKQPVAAER